MNIFVLDNNIKKCAQYHNDKHVVKMILEYAQMLSTTVSLVNNITTRYKPTHINHPCRLWCEESLSNWKWLRSLAKELNEEYKFRYNKDVNHKSYDEVLKLPIPNIEDNGITKHPLAMPEQYKSNDIVESYRNYYIGDKSKIANWKNRNIPNWWKIK